MTSCEWCGGTNVQGKRCGSCGGPVAQPKAETSVWRAEPFAYNGYIVYMLQDYTADTREVQFWLGREMIERFRITRAMVEAFQLDRGNAMEFVWQLFLLARGEHEVVYYKTLNEKPETMLCVHRMEDRREHERLSRTSMTEIMQEARL